jgi:hypothetical protein
MSKHGSYSVENGMRTLSVDELDAVTGGIIIVSGISAGIRTRRDSTAHAQAREMLDRP